jgi:uncharacterized protein with NRDE domain
MCILFLYVGTENNPTIIANNRDEYFSRATNRGVFSTNYPPQGQVNDEENDENYYYCAYSPKDLVGGGTWVNFDNIAHPRRELRYAIVLNFHHWREYTLYTFLTAWNLNLAKLQSRGKLVSKFMDNPHIKARDYAEEIFRTRHLYRPFNLLVSDGSANTYYISSSIQQTEIKRLLPGQLYGVANGYIDDNWEKVMYGKQMMQSLIDEKLSKIDFSSLHRIPTGRTPNPQSLDGLTPATSYYPSTTATSVKSSMKTNSEVIQQLQGDNDDEEESADLTPANLASETRPLSNSSGLSLNVVAKPVPLSRPVPTSFDSLNHQKTQELLNYDGKHYTHYQQINQLLEDLLNILSYRHPLPDPSFHSSSIPLMQLASIFVVPTLIVKDEKLTFWERAFGNGKFRVIPQNINPAYEKLDVDFNEIFGTRTITLFLYFDSVYLEKTFSHQVEKTENDQKEENGKQEEKITSQDKRNSKRFLHSGLFSLIETDFILNESDNYKLVKSTNVFTNL